jgi:ankyrin repeat protein
MAQVYYMLASHKGHLKIVKLLLRRGADVDVVNKANKTASELASDAGIAKVISEHKADGSIRNQIRSITIGTAEHGDNEDAKIEGEVSLHAVAEEGNIDVVKSLLERGVDVDSRNASAEVIELGVRINAMV